MSEDEFSYDDLFSSSESLREMTNAHVLIYGPEDVGKTFAALSISSKWSPELVKCLETNTLPKKRILLDDVVHVGFDLNALFGVLERGIEVPHYFNVPALMTPPKKGEKRPHFEHVEDVIEILPDAIIHKVVQTEAKAVIFDTLSVAGQMFHKRAKMKTDNGDFSSNGKVDTWEVGRWINGCFRAIHQLAMALPCMTIFASHAKARTETGNAEQKSTKQKQAKATFGAEAGSVPQVIPDIPGWQEIVNMFTANCSIICSMSTEGSDKKNLKRWLHPAGGNGFMGKNKFRVNLEADEPANLNAIFSKLAKAGMVGK